MINQGIAAVEKGANPVFLREGIELAGHEVAAKLLEKKRKPLKLMKILLA